MHIMKYPDANREDEALAKMVSEFQVLAKDLELQLMVLAQFNRSTTATSDPPRMQHIRGSAAIEQIAQKCLLIHRPWTRMTIEQKRKASLEEKREAFAIIAKNRDGGEGVVPMTFTGEAFRFDEKTRDEDS